MFPFRCRHRPLPAVAVPMDTAACRRAGSIPRRRLRSLGALVLATLSGPAGLAAQALPPLTAGEVRGVIVSRGDEILLDERGDQRMTPASLQKLVTAAAFLYHLGPDHRFRTTVVAAPPTADGAVASLTLVGDGDPTWHAEHFASDPEAPLADLAAQVRAAGIRRVAGDLVLDTSAVIGRRAPVDWSAADAALGYGAFPSALALRRNRVRVRVAPGPTVGSPARIDELDGLTWRNESITVGAERHRRGTLEFDPDWGTSTATLRGEYPISEAPFVVQLAAPDPDLRVGRAFLEALRRVGVVVEGAVRLRPAGATGGARESVVATFLSPPASEILVPMLADSDNFTAEMMLRHLGHTVAGSGRLDVGAEVVSTFLAEVVGLPEETFVVDDGSGLSASNLVTPRAILDLLRWSWMQPTRVAYFEALASHRQGTVGDYWPPSPPLRAKTGTLRHTQCLAGVLLGEGPVPAPGSRADEREPVFFVWMLNHSTRERRDIRRSVMSTLWQWSRGGLVASGG